VHGDDETVAFSRLMGHDLEILPLVDGGQGIYYGPDDQSGEFVTGPGGTFSFTPDTEGNWLVKVGYFDDTKTGDGGEELFGACYF
jgi:uncharacterized GH25 family protein